MKTRSKIINTTRLKCINTCLKHSGSLTGFQIHPRYYVVNSALFHSHFWYYFLFLTRSHISAPITIYMVDLSCWSALYGQYKTYLLSKFYESSFSWSTHSIFCIKTSTFQRSTTYSNSHLLRRVCKLQWPHWSIHHVNQLHIYHIIHTYYQSFMILAFSDRHTQYFA